MKYNSRYASFCLKCVLLSGTPKLEFWPKTGVLDCSCENLIFVQNTKTGGFHPKLEFSSCKNIDALGLPKTGVKTGVLSKLESKLEVFMKAGSLVTKTPKLEFCPKTRVFSENWKPLKSQNWRCCSKTGSFHLGKFDSSLPDQNSSFHVAKLEFCFLLDLVVFSWNNCQLARAISPWSELRFSPFNSRWKALCV